MLAVPLVMGWMLAAAAPPEQAILGQAETAFRQGVNQARDDPDAARRAFAAAAACYEELRQHGLANPRLLGNQGNACLLAGDLPHAVLAYRRGLRLAPRDPDLRRGLAHAEDLVYSPTSNLARPPEDSWPGWLPHPGAGACLALFAILYGGGWLVLTRWWMTRRAGGGSLAAGCFLAALLPAGLWLDEQAQVRDRRDHPLVIVARQDVWLRRGNGADFPLRLDTPLPAGAQARWLFGRGNWVQIQLPGGEVGWVPRHDLLVDIPSSAEASLAIQ